MTDRQSVDVDKRILIHGEGRLGEASLDQRANSPAFRLRRAAVLRNVDVDMTGFREAVLVEGAAALRPLIDGCIVRCAPCSRQHLKRAGFQAYCLAADHSPVQQLAQKAHEHVDFHTVLCG